MVSAPGVTPVPDRAMPSIGSDAVLLMVKLPVAPPADVGAKPTLKLVLCPAAKVKGRVAPLTLKPVPLTDACEIVILDPPELVMVVAKAWVLPICTSPKLNAAGDEVVRPGVVPLPVPVPVRGTAKLNGEEVGVLDRRW